MIFTLRSLRVATTILAFTSLAACSKKKDDPAPPAPTKGVSWTVDGSNVTAGAFSAAAIGTGVIITGSSTSNTGVLLGVAKAVGTYTLPDMSGTGDQDATYFVGTGQSATDYDATSGTIVVTSVTATNIAGTFTFTGRNGTTSKVLTNGKFDVNF